MRIDKWLKLARIFKTRDAAATACQLGRVKVNDQKVKASREINVGDVVVVRVDSQYRTLTIQELPMRGLSAKDAKLVYDEVLPDVPEETQELMSMMASEERKLGRPDKGRPTKRRRRELEKWRGGH